MHSFLRPVWCLCLAFGLLAQAQAPWRPSTPATGPDPQKGGPEADQAKDLPAQLEQFVKVLSTVRAEAAEQEPLDKLIYEGAIPSMLRQLDPHTQFFEPAQFEQLKQMEASEQKGFGSVVSVLPGQVIFLQIFPGTPTSKAGIQPGDELLAVNNYAIARLEPDQIIQLLTAARQQKITIFVRRQGNATTLRFELTPELVDSPSIDRAYLLTSGIGLIRIASWDNLTSRQLGEALKKLNAESLNGLVIDLRNNPGGLVKAALDAASLFLKPGERILTAKSRTGTVESADVPKTASHLRCKLAVLINGKTASASEIFTGALQDHDRAVVLGETSYGKGLVQSVVPLSEGAGLAITTAFYYTPSGRSIQKPLENSALSQIFGQGAGKTPAYKTDAGRTVLGGGGIQPDVRVSPDTPTRLETVLDASGSITAFATQYLAGHNPLPEKFEVSAELMDELKVFLSQRNIQPNIAEWTQERPWVRNRLLEELVTQARGVAQGDEIGAKRDPQIQAALTALQSDAGPTRASAALRTTQ
jgi:carboxyl-terminal processing protease